MECRKDLYRNILLIGSNAFFPGIISRLENEISYLRYRRAYEEKNWQSFKFRINISNGVNPLGNNLSFIGASIMANTYNNTHCGDYWISKEDWDEYGPNIIFKKCKNIN